MVEQIIRTVVALNSMPNGTVGIVTQSHEPIAVQNHLGNWHASEYFLVGGNYGLLPEELLRISAVTIVFIPNDKTGLGD